MLTSTTSGTRLLTMTRASQRFFAQTSIRAIQRTIYTSSSVGGSDKNDAASFSHWMGVGLGALALGLGAAVARTNENDPSVTLCSGILGVVGKEGSTRDYFLQGLSVLQKRGYDGIGIASMDSGQGLVVSKHVTVEGSELGQHDAVLHLIQEHYASHPSLRPTGMAHTRWATHGAKIQESNVHPHLDASGKIALIHNGSLINARELRDELKSMGYKFQGQTDSEVLAKLIGHYYAEGRDSNISVKDATEKALRRCIGTWGICLMCSDEPEELVVACHGSSLFIGLGDDRIYVASEVGAFSRFTKNYIAMKDGEIGVLDADGRTLDLSRKEMSASSNEEEILPPEYPHWTLKEILEQPNAVGRALGFGARLGGESVHLGGLDSNVELLKNVQHLAVVGCGSSLHAARYGEKLLKHVSAVPGRISSMDAVEADYFDLGNTGNPAATGIIALSQSGETSDVKRVVSTALAEGFTTLGVVNVVGSVVARLVKMGVYCHAGNENGIASTKSFTSQITILGLIALWFRELQDRLEGVTRPSIETERLKEALLRLPISLGMALKTREQCRKIAERISKKEHCFVLGKGFGEPIAYEGALKIKEMSYLHAEGYSGGALKHGPFALIDDDAGGKFGATPIIMLVLDDQHAHHMRTACEEVKARGADLIIITDKAELARDLDDDPIVIPTNGVMTALGALMPLQLIAYEMGVLRGNNPDHPRNLAKYYR